MIHLCWGGGKNPWDLFFFANFKDMVTVVTPCYKLDHQHLPIYDWKGSALRPTARHQPYPTSYQHAIPSSASVSLEVFRFHVHMKSCSVCLSLDYFTELNVSRFIRVAANGFPSFAWLNNILLHAHMYVHHNFIHSSTAGQQVVSISCE